MSFPPKPATMFDASSNPFLSTAAASSAVMKCIVPNCQENSVKGFPACSFHLGPVSPKPPRPVKILDSQLRTDSIQKTGRIPEAPSAQGRKQLDSKVTARKSAARPFVPPPPKTNGAKTNGASLSPVNRTSTNGSYTSSVLPETPSRKRQRISSPKNDVVSPKFARPSLPTREISVPNGNHSVLNGRERDSPLPNSYAEFSLLLERENEKAHGRGSSQDTSHASVNGTASGLKTILSPIKTESISNGQRPGSGGPVGELREVNHINRSATNIRITSLEKKQSRAPTAPAATSSKKREKIGKSPYSGLKFVTRSPPLEKQRRHLAEKLDTSALDRLVYGQEASSEPPLGIAKPSEIEPTKRHDVYYADIDPRTHWTRPHSDEWFRKKEEEIKARGGRKANLGKAAQRMREKRLNEDPDAWEETLPDRVRNNEAWLGAMRWLHSQEQDIQPGVSSLANGHESPPVRKKRPYRRRNQVAVTRAVAEPSVATSRLNSELYNSDTEARNATRAKPLP